MSGATDFADELIATAHAFDVAATPFLRSLAAGTCDRTTIAGYARTLEALSEGFPRVLESLRAICPHDSVRRSIDANLDEERGHPAMARRLARAALHWSAGSQPAGAPATLPARLPADRPPGLAAPRGTAPRFDDLLAAGDWLGAFAWMSVGIEANVPRTFAIVLAALQEHYGFGDGDVVFLREHLSADERHGREAAELIAGIATTDDMRARAREGARLGAAAWWLMHRKCARPGA